MACSTLSEGPPGLLSASSVEGRQRSGTEPEQWEIVCKKEFAAEVVFEVNLWTSSRVWKPPYPIGFGW